MFPDARISLRRWSVSAETKIPVPVAITLHNFIAPPSAAAAAAAANTEEESSLTTAKTVGFGSQKSVPPSSKDADAAASPSCSPSKEEDAARRERGMWLRRQPQHNNNLLPRLRLEITATPPQQHVPQQEDQGEDNDDQEGASSTSRILVYSEGSPQTPSLHPSWEHLDERISIHKYEEWWNQNELYKSMKIKLSVVSNTDGEGNQPEFQSQERKDDDDDDDCFLEAFLHPSFLEKIDLGSNNNNDSIEDMDRNSLLPPGLPPNAMLVHFSDGSIRCPPQIYQILWENYGHTHGILEPPPVEDFSRFEDDAFAALDNVQQTPQRARNRSLSALLDQDEDNFREETVGNSIDEDRLQDEGKSSLSEDLDPMTPPRRTFGSSGPGVNNSSFGLNEQDILKEERRQEKLELLRLIAEEERALEEDLDCLKAEQLTLTNLVKEIQLVEGDISKVTVELRKQSSKLEREEILKESQSVKLLRDLKDIFPITLDTVATLSSVSIIQSTRASGGTAGGNNGYLIRGMRLPEDIYTTTISEEEVNTSLGYCAHLVFMIAKYLAIQLRHRIFCNGSRSAIELDGVGIFPLFLGRLAARALEREQVDRGARLLGANVDCIMMHLNLLPSSSSSPPLPQSHILARLQTVLDFVAEGKGRA